MAAVEADCPIDGAEYPGRQAYASERAIPLSGEATIDSVVAQHAIGTNIALACRRTAAKVGMGIVRYYCRVLSVLEPSLQEVS